MDRVTDAKDLYDSVLRHKADPRTSSWLLMSKPWTMLLVVFSYLAFVGVGRRLMAKREAYELRRVLMCYNLLMVILSSYMLREFIVVTVLRPDFQISCEPVNYSDKPDAVRLAGAVWWFFISKVIELMDTVFFILRKRNRQVTFLHVYHHSTMVVLWWTGTKFVAGGVSFFAPMMNCFIHVLVYTYYLLSSCGPRLQKYLWWKKYLTRLQLAQFIVVIAHTLHAMYLDCGFPLMYLYVLVAYMISLIILFCNFYRKTYVITSRHGDENSSTFIDGKNLSTANKDKTD